MHDIVGHDESLDILCNEKLAIIQKKSGYRFSIDAILLAAFVNLKKHERLLDIGSGCGIIPIYIVKRGFTNDITGIELQKDLFSVAQKNGILNNCENQVHFINTDIRTAFKEMRKTAYQVIVSNPPYTRKRSGRTCPDSSRHLARYEESLDLKELIGTVSALLSKKGRFYTIYPAHRLGELICMADTGKLIAKRLRAVYPHKEEKANLVLAEFVKEGGIGITLEKPLYVYDGEHISDEVKKYYSFED